jgi:hypothetical protein
MKKTFLIFSVAISAYASQAQFQLGLLTDYHYSYLYNKSDAAADERLNYVNTYKPAFGAIIGFAYSEISAYQISYRYYYNKFLDGAANIITNQFLIPEINNFQVILK